MSWELLKEALTEIVTVNGRNFSYLEDSGLRKILDPIIEELNKTTPTEDEAGRCINRHNIKELVKKAAEDLRALIRKEVAGKYVCLKVDTATRLDRHILGVNIQFTVDWKLVIRNLAMK